MQAGAVFPPLVVFQEGEQFWLAEGFHRVGAYTAAGITEVPCVVHQGGLRDAILLSVGANDSHGVRRKPSDKRRSVTIMLEDELVAVDPDSGQLWSDREIARRCNVSHTFVSRVREELTGNVASEPTSRAYRDRHGNVSQMNTGRIGRKAEVEPDAPAELGPLARPLGRRRQRRNAGFAAQASA